MTTIDKNTLPKLWNELDWDIDRSKRYHDHRRQFFLFWHKVFVIVIFFTASSAAGAALWNKLSAISDWFLIVPSVIAATMSVIDLIASPMMKAALHDTLKRSFIELQCEFIETQQSVPAYKRIITKLKRIEKDELPPKRVIDAICMNEIFRSKGMLKDKEIPIGRFQSVFKNWISEYKHKGKS